MTVRDAGIGHVVEVDRLSPPHDVAEGVLVHRDVMVTMRDGIRLATDIYRPAQDGVPHPGPLPVILERTPYGKAERSRSEIEVGMDLPMTRAEVACHFVRHGYVVIAIAPSSKTSSTSSAATAPTANSRSSTAPTSASSAKNAPS